jgi:hypothetical protein
MVGFPAELEACCWNLLLRPVELPILLTPPWVFRQAILLTFIILCQAEPLTISQYPNYQLVHIRMVVGKWNTSGFELQPDSGVKWETITQHLQHVIIAAFP